MIRTIIAVVAFGVLSVPPVWGHDNFRIIGTLTKHQDSRIEVRKNTGGTVSVLLDRQTEISQDSEKVDATALRVGQSLVVDAYGDTDDDSLAVVIRIVPPIRQGAR